MQLKDLIEILFMKKFFYNNRTRHYKWHTIYSVSVFSELYYCNVWTIKSILDEKWIQSYSHDGVKVVEIETTTEYLLDNWFYYCSLL